MAQQQTDQLKLIQEWKQKFQKAMLEQVELRVAADPEVDSQQVREEYLLEKMATLMVGSIELGRKIRDIEARLDAEEGNT